MFSFALSIYVDYFNGFSMYGSLTNHRIDHALALFLHVYYDDECRSERDLQ